MDTRLSKTRWRLLTATSVTLAFILTLGGTPVSAATSSTCSVKNTDTGRTFPRLQQAVDAAKPGAHLVVKGTCHGGTFISKSLAIAGVKNRQSGKPILDGGVQSYSMEGSTRVLTIKPKVKVGIRDLVIRDGKATRIPDGGGISNKGKLTLRDVVVRDNYAAGRGGGIFNEGVLRMLGRSIVKSNYDTYARPGGASGVYNVGRLILDDRTRIRSNLGLTSVVNEGMLVMHGSSDISRNSAMRGSGGGVQNRGTLVMGDTASISHQGSNTNSGALVMNDTASIHDNWTSGCISVMCGPEGKPGAGVHNTGNLTLNDTSSIHDNRVRGPDGSQYPGARGGGVYNEGTVTMTGSSRIAQNEAGNGTNGVQGLGGGLYNASGGTLVGVTCAPHTYANVYGNTPDDCYFEP